jgi:hypothetical protein
VTDRQFIDPVIEDTDIEPIKETFPLEYRSLMGIWWYCQDDKVSVTERGTSPVQSPIRELVNRFERVHAYVSVGERRASPWENRLAWIGMLGLPIGIALRFVKTSLELGVPLQ